MLQQAESTMQTTHCAAKGSHMYQTVYINEQSKYIISLKATKVNTGMSVMTVTKVRE